MLSLESTCDLIQELIVTNFCSIASELIGCATILLHNASREVV